MVTVCGKALPPRAALLLIFDFVSLVLVAPLLFMVPVLAGSSSRPAAALALSLLRLIVAGLACQAIFYYNELYNLQVVRSRRDVFARLLRTFGLLFLFLSFGCLAFPRLSPSLSRVLLFAFFLASAALLARVLALPRKRERLLVIGSGDDASDLLDTLFSCPEWNLEVAQIVDPADCPTELPQSLEPRTLCDRIIVCDRAKQTLATQRQMLHWKMEGLPIEDAQGFYERATGRVLVQGLTVESCLFSYIYNTHPSKRQIKRAFDLAGALVLLLVTAPIMLIVAALIWSRRDGPVVFSQARTGHNGRPFHIYKFRTMRTAERGQQPRWAAEEHDRITPQGAFLRKYRLDELLQIFNVLKGDMSLVGPRPEQPGFCQILGQSIPFYEQRHSVFPGLTGWAQVKYHYGASIAESQRKLEFDLFYVKHGSLWLDCAILLETVKVVLVGRGAR